MHADDAKHLYVDVAARLGELAALELSGAEANQPHSLRAQRGVPQRNAAEAEAELEKLLRSGYRTVVAFERGGEADRTRYNLARRRAAARRRPRPIRASASPRARCGRASSRRS